MRTLIGTFTIWTNRIRYEFSFQPTILNVQASESGSSLEVQLFPDRHVEKFSEPGEYGVIQRKDYNGSLIYITQIGHV